MMTWLVLVLTLIAFGSFYRWYAERRARRRYVRNTLFTLARHIGIDPLPNESEASLRTRVHEALQLGQFPR